MNRSTFLVLVASGAALLAQPKFEAEMIFTPENIHNHSSSIVEIERRDA